MEENDNSNDEGFFGKVAAFWRGIFGSETEGAFITTPEIRMYGQA